MAVEVEIIGNGHYAGSKSSVGNYTVTEEATPVEGSDSSGGVGEISFKAVDDPSRLGSVLLLNDTIKLTDGDRGETQGKVNNLSANNGDLTVTATSRLGSLVVDVDAAPVNDTLANVITYYLSLGGITTNIAIDASVASIPVIAKGWDSLDLWTKIKELCVATGTEIALVKGVVVVRPIRGRRALEINNANESWTVSNSDMAQQVEIVYYNYQYKSSGLLYPQGGWNEDVEILQVDSGQTITRNIPLDITITSVSQPVPVSLVTPSYSASSVYTVSGNDDFNISPAQWTANGGKITVDIGDDGESLDVTIVGASGSLAKYAPFRLALSSSGGEDYSTLRIVGSGMFYDRQSVIMETGADASVTTKKIGVTVDNIFVKDYNAAVNLGINVTGKWASPTRTISISKADINRPGETSPNYDYAKFSDFDAYAASNGYTTFSAFDAAWTGKTFAQFDDYWYQLVKNDFDYQVFGNAIGARVQWRRAMYRIKSTNITESGVDYTAEADTTFADFDVSAQLTNMKFSDFDASYAGLTFSDFALIPLPNVNPEYDR